MKFRPKIKFLWPNVIFDIFFNNSCPGNTVQDENRDIYRVSGKKVTLKIEILLKIQFKRVFFSGHPVCRKFFEVSLFVKTF